MATDVDQPRVRRKLNLSWLKPPPMPPDGNMTLFEHLRELRYRLVVSVLAVVLTTSISGIFYRKLYDLLLWPYEEARTILLASNPDVQTSVVNIGVTAPFTLALKVCLVAGLVASAPVWLYQLWAFIMPGLLANEKKWALIFVVASTPLFIAGVILGFFVMPKGIAVMLSFTPDSVPVTNMLDLPYFLSFMLRLMIVFGIAFLIPVIVLMLNFVGVVSAAQLAKARRVVIFLTFVFGAVATPSTDPFSMLALALPMLALFLIAEVIAHIHDRSKARRDKALERAAGA